METSFFAASGRFLRTVRYLRLRQVLHLVRRRFTQSNRWSKGARFVDPRLLEQVSVAVAERGPKFHESHYAELADDWIASRCRWLNTDVAWHGDWSMQGPSLLWRFHLHYFDHISAVAWRAYCTADEVLASRLLTAIRNWRAGIESHQAVSLAAYPLSERLTNLLRCSGWLRNIIPPADAAWLAELVDDHFCQLLKRVEWELDANHLLKNLTALATCALAAPVSVQASILAHLREVCNDQIFADGWHYERSPMYHLRALRDFQDLFAASQATGNEAFQFLSAPISRMEESASWMFRGDGTLWQLNDCEAEPDVDCGLTPAVPIGCTLFRNAGCFVARLPNGDAARVDVGPPMPAHQPGHYHAGALGFELDIQGIPLIIDCGMSGYDGDQFRSYFRGTVAHSTIQVDESDQSEMWRTFRVGARSKVRVLDVKHTHATAYVLSDCKHWGRAIKHTRALTLHQGRLEVSDIVDAPAMANIVSRFHLAPGWILESETEDTISLSAGHLRVTIRFTGHRTLSLQHSSARWGAYRQSPRFGVSFPSSAICASYSAEDTHKKNVVFAWSN